MSTADPVHAQLRLDNARQSLVRMDATIVYALIERAQFRRNLTIYEPGAFPTLTPTASLLDHLLRETESAHAVMRRYTSPDEHPFFGDLPAPRLPALVYAGNPLRPNAVNLNGRLLAAYREQVVAPLCEAGDDAQYGSSAVCDVACLQALSRRIHFGKFVAEGKRQREPRRFAQLLAARDDDALLAAITHREVEEAVLTRVCRKADGYLAELRQDGMGYLPAAATLAAIYRDFIIPLNKQVQIAYLRATV